MPLSAAEAEPARGQGLAVTAEVLYLLNLLLLPGLAFVLLLLVYFRHRRSAPVLARVHLQQTVAASLWAGALLLLVNGLILWGGGYDRPHTWLVLVLYFLCCHAALVLLGVLGLARALAGQRFRYPLIGPRLPSEN
jgi:hypothetical protein